MITIELTDAQRQALQADPGKLVDVIDPTTQQHYVLLAQADYERVRALLEQGGPEPDDVAAEVSPGTLRSQQAFWRDLPALLRDKRHCGQWVAYHGDEQIGIATTKTELIREVLRRGIPRDDYYVGRIQPQSLAPWETVEVEPIDPRHLDEGPPQP
jgi:hypothetical protein